MFAAEKFGQRAISILICNLAHLFWKNYSSFSSEDLLIFPVVFSKYSKIRQDVFILKVGKELQQLMTKQLKQTRKRTATKLNRSIG